MQRFLLLALLFIVVGLGHPVVAQMAVGLPTRPIPFTFVTDQGKLLSVADAQKLEGGLRSYAEKTGTQVIIVTVPNLGGRSVADYGRALGTAWGVGQRGKNNGVVVLLSAQEHKVTIQPGSGLADVITPAVTSRVIGEMTPLFKQGNYFTGLRKGLNTLLVTANPDSDPRKQVSATALAATDDADRGIGKASHLTDDKVTSPVASATVADPAGSQQSEMAQPATPGLGLGTLLIGALVIGGGLWFIIRLFRGRSAAAQNGGSPNFYPNPAGRNPTPAQPTFYPNQGPGNGGGYPNQTNASGGSGMGGILATGAAAAAGAYLGNRMASGHETNTNAPTNFGANSGAGAGMAGTAGTGAASEYFSSQGNNDRTNDDTPDYFSGNNSAAESSGDYFSSDSSSSSDNSSYDDPSSGDAGGGDFDATTDNSGSW